MHFKKSNIDSITKQWLTTVAKISVLFLGCVQPGIESVYKQECSVIYSYRFRQN